MHCAGHYFLYCTLICSFFSQSIHIKSGEICYAENSQTMDKATFQVLDQELSNCNELLDLEPDSKWTLYTKVLIMKTMNADKFHDEILETLDTLCQIDAKRRGYYQDLKSKCSVMQSIRQVSGGQHLDLSNKGLTCLYFKERLAFFQKIDLSNNGLKSVRTLMPYLLQCRTLILDGNCLSLPTGTTPEDAMSILGDLNDSEIQYVSLKSNPICDSSVLVEKLKNELKIKLDV